MNDFLLGLKSYWRAWRLAWSARMWPFVLIPGLLGLLYFPAVALLFLKYGRVITTYVQDNWFPEFLRQRILEGALTAIIWIVGMYLGFFLFRNIIMILYAPLLGFLSEKTEKNARPNVPPPNTPHGFASSALRGIAMSLLTLSLIIGIFAISCVLLLIPILGQLIMAVGLPVAQMYLAGLSFFDPALERRGFSIAESFRLAWRNRFITVGCGCSFVLLSLLPAIGWFLAPVLGVIAGTLLAMEICAEQSPNALQPAQPQT